jgi:hypothetical protein
MVVGVVFCYVVDKKKFPVMEVHYIRYIEAV